jgi:hypothetical protein
MQDGDAEIVLTEEELETAAGHIRLYLEEALSACLSDPVEKSFVGCKVDLAKDFASMCGQVVEGVCEMSKGAPPDAGKSEREAVMDILDGMKRCCLDDFQDRWQCLPFPECYCACPGFFLWNMPCVRAAVYHFQA